MLKSCVKVRYVRDYDVFSFDEELLCRFEEIDEKG